MGETWPKTWDHSNRGQRTGADSLSTPGCWDHRAIRQKGPGLEGFTTQEPAAGKP